MKKKVKDLTEDELQSICDEQIDCESCPLSDSDFYGEFIACPIELNKREVEINENKDKNN